MSIKQKLLEELAKKTQRMKERKQEIANRQNNIEDFVLKMMNDIDSMIASTVNTSLGPTLVNYYVQSIHERIKTIDSGVKIDVSWGEAQENCLPRINGILIKWSKEYQKEHTCDPELFV